MGRHGLHLVHPNAWEKHHDLPIYGVRSQQQMNRLTSQLAKCQKPIDRLQQLAYEMQICPQAFSGDQVIALAPYFRVNELVVALHLFYNHLFGFRCDQAVQLLQTIPVPEQRLDALQVIDENLLDPVNRFQLRNLFPPYLLPQVDQILAEVRGQSHIYGSVTSSRVILLIDTSGSMATQFQTNCGQTFNRLEFVVHDLHKILHHRVKPDLKFNIIRFSTHVHRWKNSLTSTTPHHLKEAEHYLDELEAEGQTNTHDALKLALSDEEADTIYLLSDGEPSTDMGTILRDLRQWLQQRRNPCVIHTVAFLMGHSCNDPKPREFMAEIALLSGGVFRCMDPFTPMHQEFASAPYNNNPNFNDPQFVQFFQGKLRDVPPQLIQNVGLYPQQQYQSSAMATSNTPYQGQPSYPQQQYPPSSMATSNPPYQGQPSYPQQQYPPSSMATSNPPYQGQPSYPQQQKPSSAKATSNPPYQGQPPYPQQQYPSSSMATANTPYQGQPPYPAQQNAPSNFKFQIKSRPRLQEEINIPSFQHQHGHDHFNICLNIRQIVPGRDGQWSVPHTYDEFKQLHQQLEQRCAVPSFPASHHSLLHLSKQDQEQRRQDLENYIKQLYVYVSPYDHPEFDLFLLMDLHLNQIIQQA
jgi:uncharacterized protein YegL